MWNQNENERVVKNLSIKENSEYCVFLAELYQLFKNELTPVILKLVHKSGRGGWQVGSVGEDVYCQTS